jgi:hypothetical protein
MNHSAPITKDTFDSDVLLRILPKRITDLYRISACYVDTGNLSALLKDTKFAGKKIDRRVN